MKKNHAIYEGKAKTLYTTDHESKLVCVFRNDASAFNGVKREQLANKGIVNNYFNAYILSALEAAGVKTHFIERLNETESLVKKLTMIPVECVVRNRAAGGLVKRLGIEKGTPLTPPVFELFLKDDALGDPMINEAHIATFKWATESQLAEMKAITLAINDLLTPMFEQAGMLLVDYKLEFGIDEAGTVILGDEFSPDGCRIWDSETQESLDKDRFRQDLGDVVESYQIAAKRLGIEMPQ